MIRQVEIKSSITFDRNMIWKSFWCQNVFLDIEQYVEFKMSDLIYSSKSLICSHRVAYLEAQMKDYWHSTLDYEFNFWKTCIFKVHFLFVFKILPRKQQHHCIDPAYMPFNHLGQKICAYTLRRFEFQYLMVTWLLTKLYAFILIRK